MRTFVVVSGLSLVLVSSASAQSRDSSYWTLGVSRGFVTTSPVARDRNGATGSLQVEWRKAASRLGVRAELSVAERDQLFVDPYGGCSGCFSENRNAAVSGLASLTYEWRPARAFRPYVIAGAGIAQSELKTLSNVGYGLNGVERLDTPQTQSRTRLSMIVAAGLGLSANVGRFSAFVETRARTGTLNPNETFSFGLRIRPD